MDEFRNLLSKLDIHGSGTSLASALCTLFYKRQGFQSSEGQQGGD